MNKSQHTNLPGTDSSNSDSTLSEILNTYETGEQAEGQVKDTTANAGQTKLESNKVKFPHYPLIDSYYFNGHVLEIYEKEYDPTNPYQKMPYSDITDQGVIQVFYPSGTFSADEDVPEFRCFNNKSTYQKAPMYVEGPYPRVILEYPNGYYNEPKRRKEYRFCLRINPEQVLRMQGSYYSLNPVQQRMCKKFVDPGQNPRHQQQLKNFKEFLNECSQLTLQQKRQAFCTGHYNLVKYLTSRLKGRIKSKLPIPQKLRKNYYQGKFLFNHITRQLEQVKPLNKYEQAKYEKNKNKERLDIKLISDPYLLNVEYDRLHPITQKFNHIRGENQPKSWDTFQGLWEAPDIFKKKTQNSLQFRQLLPSMGVDHSPCSDSTPQIKIYTPEEFEAIKRSKKRAVTNTAHPLGKLLNQRMGNGQNPDSEQ